MLQQNPPFKPSTWEHTAICQKPYDVNQLIVTIKRAVEKKETTRALTESEKRYRQLYEGAIDGIIALDLDYNIIDYNSSLQKLLGYTDEKLKKLTIWDITPEKWHKKNKQIHKQILERGYSDLFEKEYICKDGSTVPVEISGFITRNNDGKPSGLWAFVRDISERKKTEQTLRRQLLEATALHSIASAGTDAASVDELLERTTEILRQTLYADNFGVLIYNNKKKSLKAHYSYHGLPENRMNIEEPIKNGITGRTVRTKKPQIVPDVTKDKDYLLSNPLTLSELSIPILVNNKVFGIINSESSIKGFYSNADEKLLITLANQLALAIEKIQLLEAVQQRAKEITTLYDTALATSSELETDALYQKLYHEIKNLFPMDAFSLVRYDTLSKTIEIVYLVENDRLLNEWIGRKFSEEDENLFDHVIRDRKPALYTDLTKNNKAQLMPIHKDRSIRSWLGCTTHYQGICNRRYIHAIVPGKCVQ